MYMRSREIPYGSPVRSVKTAFKNILLVRRGFLSRLAALRLQALLRNDGSLKSSIEPKKNAGLGADVLVVCCCLVVIR